MDSSWFTGTSDNQDMPSKQSTPPTVKIKSTCDACAQAKVKCDRGKPACSRCLERGHDCYYGPSQRSGRRPTKAIGLQQKRPKIEESHQAPMASSSAFPAGDYFSLNGDKSAVPWPMFPPTASSSMTEPFYDDYMTDLPFDVQVDNLMKQDVDMGGVPPTTTGAVDFTNTFTSQSMSSLSPLNSISAEDELFWKSKSLNIPADLQSMISSTSLPMSEETYAPMSRSQECSTRLLKLLTSLETKPTGSTNDMASSLDSSDGTTTTVSRIIDRNFAALTFVEEIFDYDYTLHRRQYLIIALVVSKVLDWYGAVLSNKISNFETPANLSSSSNNYFQPRASFSGDSFMSPLQTGMPPVRIGSYQYDSGIQIRQRAQLVLSELRHVIRALDKWNEKCEHCPASTPNESGPKSRGSANYSVIFLLVEADLRDSLQKVTRDAKAGLQ